MDCSKCPIQKECKPILKEAKLARGDNMECPLVEILMSWAYPTTIISYPK